MSSDSGLGTPDSEHGNKETPLNLSTGSTSNPHPPILFQYTSRLPPPPHIRYPPPPYPPKSNKVPPFVPQYSPPPYTHPAIQINWYFPDATAQPPPPSSPIGFWTFPELPMQLYWFHCSAVPAMPMQNVGYVQPTNTDMATYNGMS